MLRVNKSLILISCISTFVALISGEIIIRCFNLAPAIFDYKIFEPMEFVTNHEVCYKMKPFGELGECEGGRLNSEGFKDRNFESRKDNNTIRIIMLGDSITKGTGVNLGETFSDQLEDMLNQNSKQRNSKIKYDVMNFGVGGYNIVSELGTLKEYGLKYNPDIVVLNYFHNDNEEYSYNYYWFMDHAQMSSAEKNLIYQYYLASNKFRLKRLFFRSHLFVFCWATINKIFEQDREINHAKVGTYKKDIVSEKIMELKKLAEKHSFIPIICMHPVLDYDINQPHENYESTKSIAKRMDILCIDLNAVYQRESGDPKIFLQNSHDEIHPNAQGHTLIAQALFELLQKENITEVRRLQK